MAEAEGRHVIVVPWSGEGHVTGMLRLAFLMAAQKGLLVSFGYPARAHALALKRGKLPGHLPPSLRLHVIQDGLPPPDHGSLRLHHLTDSSSVIVHSLEAFLQRHVAPSSGLLALDCTSIAAPDSANEGDASTSWPPVCCIISDTFLPKTQALANRFGIPRVNFWTGNATVFNIFHHIPQLLAKGVLPLSKGTGNESKEESPWIDFIPGLPPCHVTQLPWDLLQTYDVSQPMVEFLVDAFSVTKDAERILVYSVYELEKHVYDVMQAQGFPIYAIGPLFQVDTDSMANRDECLDWLDQQKAASVVYVAFGTMARLSLQEVQSMALGLEASSHPFIWVIPENPLHTSGDACERFLDEFMERTASQGKGCIVPWAPQREVLKHRAVGAFISHCGWNSVLESLWEGVPVVTCARVAEQNCNAKSVVEDWKVGIEMARKDDDSFTTEGVQKAVQEIMASQEVKARALHFKQVVRHAVGTHGTSHANLMSLIDHLLHLPVPKQCT